MYYLYKLFQREQNENLSKPGFLGQFRHSPTLKRYRTLKNVLLFLVWMSIKDCSIQKVLAT